MKTVKALQPFKYDGCVNFKLAPYEAWVKRGGETVKTHYPMKGLRAMAYRYELPTLRCDKDTAVLAFVEPVLLYFETFPYYATHEIVPFFWDVWPEYEEKVCDWLDNHNVRTAIFTSSQTAEKMRRRYLHMNIMYCPEAIDAATYKAGKPLAERTYDYLEYGRCSNYLDSSKYDASIKIMRNSDGKQLDTREKLVDALADSKIVLCLTRYVTAPRLAGNIDTLTQRFWEGLLSGTIVLGHAPRELVDLLGYNPVVELENDNASDQICYIKSHINDYQPLVDRNREAALRLGDWYTRMDDVRLFLEESGYKLK